jgi:HSP20 family protein
MEVKNMSEKEKIEVSKKQTINGNKKDAREITIRRDSPFSLFQEMDRFFDDMMDDFMWPFGRRTRRPLGLIIRDNEPRFRTPLANIHETEKQFSITAELPGINKGDIELTIQDGVLEIKGETEEVKKEEKEGQLIRREYRSSKYYRCFNLPEHIDENNIEANLEKGILNINIPKVEPKEPEKKKITIE